MERAVKGLVGAHGGGGCGRPVWGRALAQNLKSSPSLSPRLGVCPGRWFREPSIPSLRVWLSWYPVPRDHERAWDARGETGVAVEGAIRCRGF